jgi:DNA-binding XRE family transcriptional regulator
MRSLYLPYKKLFDKESATWCLTGHGSRRRDFGVAAARDLDEAAVRLRKWVLDSLSAAADDGEDRLRELYVRRPEDAECLVFGPQDLLPIRIRVLRARHGWSQAAIAERLGISQQAYAKLERPGANPELETLIRVEQALQASVLEYAS